MAPPGAKRHHSTAGTEQPAGAGHPTSTCQSDTDAPEIAQAIALGFKRRRVVQMYRYFKAQANLEASFVDWLTYSDPTGERATNNVLWEHATAVA